MDIKYCAFQYLLASPDKLTQRTYNVTGFSFTPEEIAASIRRIIPNFKIEYEVCPIRQKIGKILKITDS